LLFFVTAVGACSKDKQPLILPNAASFATNQHVFVFVLFVAWCSS
jgi:hypothetical protein